MRKILGSIILFSFGWKVTYPTEYRICKMVVLAAPHTSSWDTLFTLAAYWKDGLKPKFLIHDKFTKGVFGYFFRKAGAIAVNNKKYKSLVDYSVDLFNNSSELLLIIAPEGTKYRTEKWRTGFLKIASLADVPLCLGRLDYRNRIAGIGGLFKMSGNFNSDMKYIQHFYEDANPKYPERYNKNIF